MFLNKKGGYTDLFLFIIMTFVFVTIFGIFIFLGGRVNSEVQEKMGDMVISPNINTSEVINQTIGQVNRSYQSLYWISIFIILGMILSIFIGSYLVTTKPIFFIPYIFIIAIATVVSVGISNAYELIIANPTIAATFDGFVGANFILANLPMWTVIIGFIGGIIMFSRIGSKEEVAFVG